MASRTKIALLYLIKYVGGFSIFRAYNKDKLRILGYHGGSFADEHTFRPGLFITGPTFERRLNLLSKNGYRVISLQEAIEQLKVGQFSTNSVVITIDDGWLSTAAVMAPILKQKGIPSTLYACSYYMDSQTQVFNVAVDYVLWKSKLQEIDLNRVDTSLKGLFQLDTIESRAQATSHLWEFANSLDTADSREALLSTICDIANVDYSDIVDQKQFFYMTQQQASELEASGMDVQLHTHRHVFPKHAMSAAKKEIDDNRESLSFAPNDRLVHFCFPSGDYCKEQLPWLNQMDIVSATTTQRGMVAINDDPFELNRYLDSEDISDIEFEAELSGFTDFARSAAHKWLG